MSKHKYGSFVDSYMKVAGRAGEEWTVSCPVHPDRNPSCSINVRTGAWICYSCGARGGIKHLERIFRARATGGSVSDDYLDGLRERAAEVINRPRVESTNIYPEAWLNQFDQPTDYWRKRGFGSPFASHWRLGYDTEHHAATIPLRTLKGEVIGVIRRYLSKKAKPRYKYPSGLRISQYVWGLWEPREQPFVVITEGSVDALAMWQAGIPAVALLGSRVSDRQARIIRSIGAREIISALDNDKAGHLGTHELHEKVTGVRHTVAWEFGKAKDVAELGQPERREIVRTALPYHEWRGIRGVTPPPDKKLDRGRRRR